MNLTTKQSLVYVIQAQGTSLCKLGVTTDVKARFRTIQTGCPHKCIILATWPGSKRLETKLHNHFAEYRREGEWFELPPFCGKQIWDIVRAHDTAGLVAPRVRRSLGHVASKISYPKPWRRGQSQGVAVPAGLILQKSGLGWSVMRHTSSYIDGKRRHKRFYVGYLNTDEYARLLDLPRNDQREFISMMVAIRDAKIEQAAPAA